jgi:WhiB family redox-sensing transcriptional regulator
MYGPGTAAVASGAAGFESVSAPEPVRSASGLTEVGRAVVPAARSAQLPCTEDPELFFAESPEDVETAKAMCRGCKARLACLTGALERREPWGVWGGELLMRGAIVPRKRPRGRPRKAEVAA